MCTIVHTCMLVVTFIKFYGSVLSNILNNYANYIVVMLASNLQYNTSIEYHIITMLIRIPGDTKRRFSCKKANFTALSNT